MTESFDVSRMVRAAFAYACFQIGEKGWEGNPPLLDEVKILPEASSLEIGEFSASWKRGSVEIFGQVTDMTQTPAIFLARVSFTSIYGMAHIDLHNLPSEVIVSGREAEIVRSSPLK